MPQAGFQDPKNPDLDEQCANGQHKVFNPETNTYEVTGTCEQMHAPTDDQYLSDMSKEAANPTTESQADALYQQQIAAAGNGRPPSPEELQATQAMLAADSLYKKIQGKKPQRMGVPGAAEAVEKAFK